MQDQGDLDRIEEITNKNEAALKRWRELQITNPSVFASYEEFERAYSTHPNFEGQEPV